MWKARSTVEKASHYIQHATTRVFPALEAIDGHRGAYLLQRPVEGEVEIVVLTLWESMEAVGKLVRRGASESGRGTRKPGRY